MPPESRGFAQRVARISLAGLFGGPVAALQEAGGIALDLAFGGATPDARKRFAKVSDRIEAGLVAFARGEGIDAAATARALENVRQILTEHPLTVADLTGADLDPDRAAAVMRRRAEPALTRLDDTDRRLTGMALDAAVGALAAEAAELPDLTREFQGAVLSRLSAQAAATDELRETQVVLEASAVLHDAAWPWWREQYPPSALLRAQYRIVPFFGRERALDDLVGGLSDGPMTSLRIYTGPGGMGKTRLLLEACARARDNSWRAGFLHPTVERVTARQLDLLAAGAAGVLVAVDYAEIRRGATAALIEAALGCRSRVRIVLLARSAGDWWLELRHAPGPVGDFVNGPAVTRHELAPLASDPGSRADIHRQAVVAFSAALDVPGTVLGEPLDSPLYDRVLFIHLHALAAVLGDPTHTQDGLLSFALRREQGFLDRAMRDAGLPQLAGRAVRQAAALVTMAGGAAGPAETVELLRQAPLLGGQPDAALAVVGEVLHCLYPAAAWLAGVQPDLLGEHLVAATLDDDPLLLGAFNAVH
ncbi:hypothetical protein ACLQ3B_28145 [Micromonospora sp. DT53]|uniref:NACHT N-terminal Helical domain 1-containing protein n=1 Tax=Micromonospora sp. DT53 TaxID=3393444 RepID=UPI003CEF934F